jgi:acetyltransferase-like isoleucine patch superfamily enzyme
VYRTFLTIGNNVGMGFRVTFVTSSHDMADGTCRAGDVLGRPIVIEDGVWVGGNVTIGPGVTIGSGSVIGSGAVVMRSIPPYSLVVGVPARVVKRLEDTPVCAESQTHESALSGP